MKILQQYFELQKQIHDYFSYQQDWVPIPLSNQTDQYWMLHQKDNGGGQVVWYPEPFTSENIIAGKIYGGIIYTQRFLPKWVYRAAEYTMISVDTQTDGVKELMVFDNVKECTDPKLMEEYLNHW